MFRAVLVANRGEIARRIIRTLRRLGIASVAVFSDADAGAPHVREADRSVRIGPAPAARSYLDIDAIVDAAVRTGAEAVHPGYGFLAENAAFARACEAKGLVFVGPSAETIRLMADKSAAKRHVEAAGVPVIPGESGDGLDGDDLARAAARLGYPVLVKAVAGGGGKGMRRVDAPPQLEEAVGAARREAQAAFGDPRILLEKVVDRPRHVEVQVFGDTHGNVVHLFERECSIQRRHQKIVEEAPSPAVDGALREAMTGAAVAAARSVGYRGAGTVEMLLSATTGNFYFLEMNTRLQVEHPVTEAITGLDLVEWQLEVAAGRELPLTQEAIGRSGHAVEVRLYAEDPAQGYLPQSGRILRFRTPRAGDVRVDAGVEDGTEVTPHYDPMLAKLIVHAEDRDGAVERLRSALDDTAVLGLITNVALLRDVAAHPAFAAADLSTAFLDEHLPDWTPPPATTHAVACAVVALVASRAAPADPWVRLGPWRPAGVGGWRLHLRDDRDGEHHLTVRAHRGGLATGGDLFLAITDPRVSEDGRARFRLDGEEVEGAVATDGPRRVWVHVDRGTVRFDLVPATRHADPALAAAGTAFTSPMPGTVAAVNVTEGDHVDAGALLVVVEAMKMEHPVRAPVAGTVTGLHVSVGDAVDADQALVALEPDPARDDPDVE